MSRIRKISTSHICRECSGLGEEEFFTLNLD